MGQLDKWYFCFNGDGSRRRSGAESNEKTSTDLKELHAKIGQQALEIDFLSGALGRMGDASAKR